MIFAIVVTDYSTSIVQGGTGTAMQQHPHSPPWSLCCLAAPADQPSLKRWETHVLPLQHSGLLTFWSEQHIPPGGPRMPSLTTALAQADLIVVLVSADFFANQECLQLMDQALCRHQAKTARIIPLLVRSVLWRDTPLRELACLPANEVPVLSWGEEDEGWYACALELSHLMEGLSRSSQVVGDARVPHALQQNAITRTALSSSCDNEGGKSLVPRSRRGLPPGSSTLPSSQDHSDRGILLARLRWDYHKDLETLLERLVWQELGLAEQPTAVRNATHLSQHLPDRTEYSLSAGTSILQLYDASARALLILGEPGAGKSTLLTRLALDLVKRAETEETHPLPVVLSLSSWSQQHAPLEGWLVEQMADRYELPRLLGQRWLRQNQVILLLDGLDEMDAAARPRCIAAINTFRRTSLSPLVVCSRTTEYHDAAMRQRLILQNAVIVQPLTTEQIAQELQRGGNALASLHEALTTNEEFHALATSPLMLSVLVLTYHGQPLPALPQHRKAIEHQVWEHYVTRMTTEKGAARPGSGDRPQKRYTPELTRCWLGWLARQMRVHHRTWFTGEALEESWLPPPSSLMEQRVLFVAPAMLLGSVTTILLTLVLATSTDPISLVQQGLVGCFLGWCGGQQVRKGNGSSPQKRHRRRFFHLLPAFLLGVLLASSLGLNLINPLDMPGYTLQNWLRDGTLWGSIFCSCGWFLQWKLTRARSRADAPPPAPRSLWSRLTNWSRIQWVRQALWTGTVLGIGFELPLWLGSGYSKPPGEGLSLGFSSGLSFGFICFLLREQTANRRLAERIHWRSRTLIQWPHLRSSILIVLAAVSFFGLSYGLAIGLYFGLNNGLNLGLSQGLAYGLSTGLNNGLNLGLSQGLSVGLSYWILFGLYRGLGQEHLEEYDRRQFNQGLRRSLVNTFLLSLLSAVVLAGITVVLGYGLSIGLNYWMILWLSDDLSQGFSVGIGSGLSVSWLLAACGWLVVWAATGGLTILRHYTLRLLLARRRTFPLDARQFLDDAVARVLLKRQGGGYSFIHRRLLDFFADAVGPTTTNQAFSVSQHMLDEVN